MYFKYLQLIQNWMGFQIPSIIPSDSCNRSEKTCLIMQLSKYIFQYLIWESWMQFSWFIGFFFHCMKLTCIRKSVAVRSYFLTWLDFALPGHLQFRWFGWSEIFMLALWKQCRYGKHAWFSSVCCITFVCFVFQAWIDGLETIHFSYAWINWRRQRICFYLKLNYSKMVEICF